VLGGGTKYEVWTSGELEGAAGLGRFLRIDREGVTLVRRGNSEVVGEGEGVVFPDELVPEGGVVVFPLDEDEGGPMEAPFLGADTDDAGAVWLTEVEDELGLFDEVS